MSTATSELAHSNLEPPVAAPQPGFAWVLSSRLLGYAITISGTVLILSYDLSTLTGRVSQFCFLLGGAGALAALGFLFNVGEQTTRTAPLDPDTATTKELVRDLLTRPHLGVGFGRFALYGGAVVFLILSIVCLLRTH